MTAISTSAFYNQSIANMDKITQATQTLSQQLSTGNRLTHSYDDPIAAAQMRTMQAADTLSTADTANAASAKASLTLTDSTLSQFTDIITKIQTAATAAASDTANASDKANYGVQINAYYQQLVDLSNTKDSYGNYVFSGTSGGSPAYTQDASGNATYTGGASANAISLGGSLSVIPSVTGPEVMNFTTSGGVSGNLLTSVKTLADQLQAGTATSASMNASGGALDQLDAALNQVSSTQTVVGARTAWITTATTVQTTAQTARTSTEAAVGGTDYTTATAQLSQQMLALSASQASFAKLSSMSLFTYLN
ncbi:flagellar biosynthesis protein FlgL [Novosphingobium sp.]|jgi:flagellar hook-associated protein 3 FlgL|uniref:flagellin N-terminal helical domain-containing protein n=1 Tax=Novosphingobium sp. TaxID=1874826 RepID=UPI0031DDD4E4